MIIDWKKQVEDRKEALLSDLNEFLSIASVRDDSQKASDAPFGPGPKAALEKFDEFAKRDNFQTTNLDNYVEFIEYGTKDSTDDYVAILAHADVMPAGDGWTTDPFVPVVKDEKLYARGSSDDKGPGIAAYYGLKIVRDLNLPLKHKVRFIMGSDEENDWEDIEHYFESEKQPLLGFSPDADFPIINGEKGLGQYQLTFQGDNNEAGLRLLTFQSGLRTNMVPGQADAKIDGFGNANDVINQFNEFLNANNEVSGFVDVVGETLQLHIDGKQVHGAFPETGINAGTYLAAFLDKMPFNGKAKAFLNFLGVHAHQTTDGKKLNIDITDEVMGSLSFNVGIMQYKNDGEGLININIRYPKGTDEKTILNGINNALSDKFSTRFVSHSHNQLPHYVSPEDSLVKTLLNVFEEQTGLKGHDQVIGGGTYGRTMKRGVAYGAMFEGDVDTMHQVNEFIPLERIFQAAAIYAQAIYEIANID